jgi:hypothetical protein
MPDGAQYLADQVRLLTDRQRKVAKPGRPSSATYEGGTNRSAADATSTQS